VHRLDERRFHGPVNVIMIESHLWDRYDRAEVEADTGIRPTRTAEMFTDAAQGQTASRSRGSRRARSPCTRARSRAWCSTWRPTGKLKEVF
jgi:hypothetical protein